MTTSTPGDLLEQYIDTRLDQTEVLYLTIPATSPKSYLLAPDLELEVSGRRYYIAELEQHRDRSETTVTVEAPALWYRLADEAQPGAVTITDQTAAAGLAQILAASTWSAGDGSTIVAATHNLEAEDLTTLQLLRRWARITGTFLRFDTVNRRVDLVATRGRDLGLAFRYARNVDRIRRRSRPPEVTRLYAYGKSDLSIAGVNGGSPFVEDLSYYTAQGITAAVARDRYGKAALWSDTSYVTDVELLAAAQARLAILSQPVVTYELDVFDIDELTGVVSPIEVGDTVRITDPDFGDDLRATVVRYVDHPLEPWRNIVELAYLVDPLNETTESATRTNLTDAWLLFTGAVAAEFQIRNDADYTVARIPLRFSEAGAAHHHLDIPLVGVGSGTAHVEVYDNEAAATVFRQLDIAYTNDQTVHARMSWAATGLAGPVDYRLRVSTTATGGPHPSAGVNIAADNDDEASFYVLAQNAVRETPTAANTITLEPNGGASPDSGAVQLWTVPDNVTEIELEAHGARGGDPELAAGGPGQGAKIIARFPVTPGEILEVYVGKSGSSNLPGWPDGGSSATDATLGGAGENAGSGGGSSSVRRHGTTFADSLIVAAAGGGATETNITGSANGGDGGWSAGADGGGSLAGAGATQWAGGTGGDGIVSPNGDGYDGTQPTFDSTYTTRVGSRLEGWGGGDNPYTAPGASIQRYVPGGAGGGWRGGGGGGTGQSAFGGGGGGSSWVDYAAGGYLIEAVDGGATHVVAAGPAEGGKVTISWETPIGL